MLPNVLRTVPSTALRCALSTAALCGLVATAGVQAAPVVFTTTGHGIDGEFSTAGNWGQIEGTGPFDLTVSVSFDDWRAGDNVQAGNVDFALTLNGMTHHVVETGYSTVQTRAGIDSAGNAVTVLKYAFGNENGQTQFNFSQSLTFSPDVLAVGALPDATSMPLAARQGRTEFYWLFSNDVVDVVFGWGGGELSTGSVVIASAVPEPSSYAMLLGGLALVGGVAARRRRTVAATA